MKSLNDINTVIEGLHDDYRRFKSQGYESLAYNTMSTIRTLLWVTDGEFQGKQMQGKTFAQELDDYLRDANKKKKE